MPGQGGSTSPFEVISASKPKKGNRGLIIGILVGVFLILSVVAGVILIRQQQNIQERAASAQCPGAEDCAVSNSNLLRSCHPADTDGTVQESLCNLAGRVETCGPATIQYCCPAAGGSWTTDLTVCNQLASTPTPTPTVAPTPIPTATATVSPNPSATPNLLTDSNNCGSVGFACAVGQSCISGICSSVTSSATPLPTLQVQTTPRPIPVTGIDWPTMVGVGGGAAAIIFAVLLAL